VTEAVPTQQEADDLTRAVAHNFGNCNCHKHSGLVHPCDGHSFIFERDRIAYRWQYLLWMRAMRPRLLTEEGAIPAQPSTPVDPRGTLPW